MSEVTLTPENYKSFYSWAKFKDLNEASREELIRFSIEQIRQEKGLKDVRVDFYSGDSTSRGSCTQDFKGKKCIGHTVRLNNDILSEKKNFYSPYRTFNTINHELEHASQYEHASNRKIKNSDPSTLEQRLNDQHYYRSDGDKRYGFGERTFRFDENTDYQMYRAQACEAEARAAGYAAVEGLKKEGQNDVYLDAYLRTQKAREINNNRQMMQQLGMHSREEMAKEELQYLSNKKVSEEDRQRVLEYARQKDYETAKEVLQVDSHGKISEENMKKQFESNDGYSNFYNSNEYNSKKVKDYEHKNYSYANYKWDDNGEIEDEIDTNEEVISQGERESRLNQTFGQKVKSTTAGLVMSASMQNTFNAYDNGYKTTAGYNASLLAKGAVRVGDSISHKPGGSPLILDSAETFGHTYDEYRALTHPDEVIDFSPKPVSQEIIDKHTLVVTDPSDPYGSSVYNNNGDEVFFKDVEEKLQTVGIKEDAEFFSKQQSLQDGETIKEDRSFFEKVENKMGEFADNVEEKAEKVAETVAEVTPGIKGHKQ